MGLGSGHQGDDEDALVDSLSPREVQLLEMATNGLTDQAIAHDLGISLATVSTYWGRIRIKYGPLGRTEIVARYLRALMNRANAVLRGTEARFRKVLEASPMGIILTDAAGVALYANPAHERITGQTLEDLVESGVNNLVHPEDRDRVVDTWERCLHEGTPYHSEHRYVRPDGTALWVRSHGDSWHEGAEIGGRVSLIEDVTLEHEAHARRQESEERYQTLFAFAPVAIVSVDGDLGIVGLNDSALRMFGYALDEIVGRPLQTLVPDVLRGDSQAYIEAFGGGSPKGLLPPADRPEARGVRKDGSDFPCEASVVRQSVDGQPHYTAIVREVAERVPSGNREESLDAIPLLAWRLDGERRFVEGNALFRGYAGGSTVPVAPEDRGAYDDALRRAADAGRSQAKLRLDRASDGATRWHLAYLQRSNSEGWSVVCADVHELEVAADELRRVKAVFGNPA